MSHNSPTMSQTQTAIDLVRLMKLRLVVARFGEMDGAKWWNTNGVLGRKGKLLMSRGFPKTHRFAQARVVFAVAKARSAELFNVPGCATLWHPPASLEDEFDSRWQDWLDESDQWESFFDQIHQLPSSDLVATLEHFELISEEQKETVAKLRRAAQGRAVLLSGVTEVSDDAFTILAAAFSRGEVGNPAIPYLRLAS